MSLIIIKKVYINRIEKRESMSRIYIAMYHYTRDLENSRYPQIKGLDYKLFKQQLEFFNEKFNVITMEDVIESWDNPDKKLPKNPLLLTFDDGYIDNYTYAFPLLKKYGMQGSFFIPGKTFHEDKLLDVNKIHFILASAMPTEILKDLYMQLDYYRSEACEEYESNDELFKKYAVENRFDCKETIFIKRILQTVIPENIRNEITSNLFKKYVGISEKTFARELYMNYDQIEYMKNNGMFIGLHGYDHYWLNNLSKSELEKDVNKSLEVMSDFIDNDRWVMNYPYGSYSEEVASYISSRGCVLGLTTEVRVVDTKNDNRFKIPRLDCNDFPPKSEIYLQK